MGAPTGIVTLSERPEPLTLAAVRATLYADHAEVEADQEDGPDTLEQACNHEANFILDRYSRNEGWNTTRRQIEEIHEELVTAGIGAARGAMIELAGYRLAGVRKAV